MSDPYSSPQDPGQQGGHYYGQGQQQPGGYGQQPYGGPPPYEGYQQAQRKSPLPMLAMIFGIIGFFTSFLCGLFAMVIDIVAIVCGIVGLVQGRQSGESTGRGQSIAGIVLGGIGVVIVIAIMVWMVQNPNWVDDLFNR